MDNECSNFENLVERVAVDFLGREPYNSWNKILESTLSDHRYRHVVRVTRTAIALARYYGEDENKAGQAAFLHDMAKKNEKKYFNRLLELGCVKEVDWQPSPYLHAYIGGLAVHYLLGLEDMDIVRAIQSHTLGSDHMSALDKIIFLADLIEPGREFPTLPELQEAALEGLNEGVLKAMNNTINYLVKNDSIINPQTIIARNALLEEMKEEKKG